MQEKTKNNWKIKDGRPWPLGTVYQGQTVNFAHPAKEETECLLRIYEKGGKIPLLETPMHRTDFDGAVFHLALEGFSSASYEYCYVTKEVEYPDIYAKAVTGRERFGVQGGQCRSLLTFSSFDWKDDTPPLLDYATMILYKLHVRGFTKHESSKVKKKGTYLGLLEKADYFKELGVNALLLMPCVEFQEMMQVGYQAFEIDQANSNQKNKINYWGYGTESYFFAPKASFAFVPEKAEEEFKTMVKNLHAKGIEILMEFCFDPSCSARFILDCLRYWVKEYHVDGFRLIGNRFLSDLVAGDPYFAKTKFLSEAFDEHHLEKNKMWASVRNLSTCREHFLIAMRRFIKGEEGQVQGVAEVFKKNSEKLANINFITDHNGFTLMDLYTYDLKHNEANEEGNQDGSEQNHSWNCGEEGKTRKKKILQLRLKMIKNALALLFLSQGTPMLLAGDEFGNSQDGNNNVYCQDNRLGWIEWNQRKYESEIINFVKQLIKIRKEFPVFCNRQELFGRDFASVGSPDISFHGTKAWYPDYSSYSRTLGILLNGHYVVQRNKTTEKSVYLIINMHWEEHEFDLPTLQGGREWKLLILTEMEKQLKLLKKACIVPARSIVVFAEEEK